jgi:hypothetical protein
LSLWLLDILIAGLLVLDSWLCDILSGLNKLGLRGILVLGCGLNISDWLGELLLVIGRLDDLCLGEVLGCGLDISLRDILCWLDIRRLHILGCRLDIGLRGILSGLDILSGRLDIIGVTGSQRVDHLGLGGLHKGDSLGLEGGLRVLRLAQRDFHGLRLRIAHRGKRRLGIGCRWLGVRWLSVAVGVVSLRVRRLEFCELLRHLKSILKS